MPVKAYILVSITAREVKHVLEKLKASRVVQSAEAVTGPYDIIATAEAADLDTLGQLITEEIQSIEGIDRTLTCIALKL